MKNELKPLEPIEKEEEEIQKMGEYKKILGIRVSALIEILIFFAIMIILDLLFGKGVSFFHVCPHPFWIIVILLSVQYGIIEGLLATVVATIVLFLGYIPERIILQDKFEYFFFLFKNPILWLVAAVILGEIRMRHIRERDRLRKIAIEAKEREKTIVDSYENLKKVKEHIEINFATEMQTALMAYNSFKELEKLGRNDMIKGGMDLVRILLAPDKFSCFLLEANQLRCVSEEGWEEKDAYAREFAPEGALFEEIVGERRALTVVSEADRVILDKEGCMAAPILDPASRNVYGMIKIEQIPFMRWRINTTETLRLIGEWVGTAYASALAKEEAEEKRFIAKDTDLLTFTYFEYQKEFLSHLGKRLNIDVTLLTIFLNNPEAYARERRTEILKAFRAAVKAKLRAVDQAFEFEKKGAEMALILINTSVENSEIVKRNIQEELEKRLGKAIAFTYQMISLYEKPK